MQSGKRKRSVNTGSWFSDRCKKYDSVITTELSSIAESATTPYGLLISDRLFMFTAYCSEQPVFVLLNSGAQSNFISSQAVQRLQLPRQHLIESTAVRHSNQCSATVESFVSNIQLVFQDNNIIVCCIEVPNLNYDIILG